MRRTEKDADEPLLFDLPLEPSAQGERPPVARTARPVRSKPEVPASAEEPSFAGETDEDEAPPKPRKLSFGTRFAAGFADLLVHAAVLVVLLIGTRLLGVRPALSDWPAFVVFFTAFSFLYMVVPLAFWGHTLGMAWGGLFSRNADGEPLTFDQTARRWLGGVLTVLLLGLPLLLTGSRRSLADRISGSETRLSHTA